MERRNPRFIVLFVSLLVLIGGYPIFQRTISGEIVFAVLWGFVIFSTILATSDSKSHKVAAWTLGVPSLFLLFTPLLVRDLVPKGTMVDTVSDILIIALFSFAIFQLLRYVFTRSRTTTNEVFAGMSAYLLLGVMWAAVHQLVALFLPGSYAGIAHDVWGDFIYFSFTTLTTMGYGDVVPVLPIARSFAALEAVMGVFLTVVFIARLVATAEKR